MSVPPAVVRGIWYRDGTGARVVPAGPPRGSSTETVGVAVTVVSNVLLSFSRPMMSWLIQLQPIPDTLIIPACTLLLTCKLLNIPHGAKLSRSVIAVVVVV